MMRMILVAILGVGLQVGCKKKEDDSSKAPAKEPTAAEEAPKTAEPEQTPEPTAAPAEMSPAAALVMLKVKDYAAWKTAFEANAAPRKEAGIIGHHLNQGVEDPNTVGVYFPLSDAEKFKGFLASEDLKEVMKKAGVEGPPTIVMMKPMQSTAILDRELAAMVVQHEVADYEAWKKGYDSVAELRKSNGIVGEAVSQALDNPNMVIVYHQAEDMESLAKFMELEELKAAMKSAGVKSAPQVSFHKSNGAMTY